MTDIVYELRYFGVFLLVLLTAPAVHFRIM